MTPTGLTGAGFRRWRQALGGLVVALGLVGGPAVAAAGASSPAPPPGSPIVPPSASAPTPVGTLTRSQGVLGFHGAVDNPTPLPLVQEPVPVVCAAECREFRFTAATTEPFLVGIKSTVTGPNGAFNANDGFDLYLYDPAGRLVGAANGIGANGQSLSVARPTAGSYTIVVTLTYAEDPNAAYDGQVRLMASPWWSPPAPTCGITVGGVTGCFDLPDLRSLPPYDLAVSGLPPAPSTPLGFPFPATVSTPTSCYADESLGLDNPSAATLAHPTQRCLRFTSDVQDVGAGNLEVRIPWVGSGGGTGGVPSSGFVPGECQAQQVVVTSRGQQVTRPAGPCEFHPEHGHFHYKNLVSYNLYRVASGGGIGARVTTSQKESFCLGDDDYFGFGSPGPNGPRTFVGQPGCNVPSDLSSSAPSQGTSQGAYVVEGITSGWGDVYTWDTPDQYIDVTNVPAGSYDLVEQTNPNGAMLVAGPAKTCALTQLQLTATSVKMLSTQPSVACPAS